MFFIRTQIVRSIYLHSILQRFWARLCHCHWLSLIMVCTTRTTQHVAHTPCLVCGSLMFCLHFTKIIRAHKNKRTHSHTNTQRDDKNDINFGNTQCQLSVLNKPTTTTTTTATQITIIIMRESKVTNKCFQNWTKNIKNKYKIQHTNNNNSNDNTKKNTKIVRTFKRAASTQQKQKETNERV